MWCFSQGMIWGFIHSLFSCAIWDIFLLACIITHALSLLTQISAINCLYESNELFWDIWLWFSFNVHENQISVNKKWRFLGKPESWKSSASALNWPRAPSCPWISDQGNQRSWSLFLEVLALANQKSARQCLGPVWDGMGQGRMGQNKGCAHHGPSQSVQLVWQGRVVRLMNPSLSISPMGHKRGAGYYFF